MERLKGTLYGAFIGDAFALSTHWIYDTDKLSIEANAITDYAEPSKNLFHKGKRKGDFTHYGDQSLLLLKSISSNDGFSTSVFKTHWLSFMDHYEGYMDHASKDTLRALDPTSDTGSSSDELGGFVRCAPLIFRHFDDENLFGMVKAQTQLTHNDPFLVEIATYTTSCLLELIIGKPLLETLENQITLFPSLRKYYDLANKDFSTETVDVIKDIGQSCSSHFAFPAALHIAIKYHDDFMKAMQTNILCGGDSAGRGMLIGMLLGANMGINHLPPHLISGLREHSIIENFASYKRI